MSTAIKTAAAFLAGVGEDPTKSLVSLLLEAMVFNVRGEFSERDDAIDAAAAVAEGLGRCGLTGIGVQLLLLSRTVRPADVA